MQKLSEQTKAPLYAAVALGGLHLASAMRMSLLRISHSGDREYFKSRAFECNRRAQVNLAEYSGPLLAMLVYLGLHASEQQSIATLAVISSYGAVCSSLAYWVGFSTAKSVGHSNSLKFGGALGRYVSYAGILVSVFQTLR